MLKQILVTSACIAILAVSAQSATAAGTKFRQLVVEPAGTPSSDLLLKNKKIQPLIATAGQGIPTPSGAATGGKAGGNPGGKFIVAQGGGIPTPAGNGGTDSGKIGGPPTAQFLIAPTGGIPTGAGGAGGNGKAVEPLLVNAPSGIPVNVATADPGVPADIAPPVTPSPQASLPATGNGGSGIVNADAAPAANPDAGTPPVIASAPAAAAADGAAGSEPPVAAAAAAPASAVQNPTDLYTLLTGRGYRIQIMDHQVNGNLVFYVTIPGDAKDADLLLVDATYGKVIDRKHIATSSYHTVSYAAGDNCEHFAGY
jgi:hypothetical protein